MAKVIYKYQLQVTDSQRLKIHSGFEFMSVQSQFDGISLWALVDTDKPMVEYEVLIYGTGYEIYEPEHKYNYVGTVQTYNGNYVWHIFIRNTSYPTIVKTEEAYANTDHIKNDSDN